MTSYKASGRYSIAGLLGFWIGALLGGILLSAGYVYLLGLVSNLLLRVLVVVGYDVAISGWLIWLVRKTKIRNTRVVLFSSIVLLLLAYYNNWAIYVMFVQDTWQKGASEVWAYHFQFPLLLERWWNLVRQPGEILGAAIQILPTGFVTINQEQLRGVLLLCTWIAEFLIMFFLPLYHVVYRAARPFNEEKQMWLPTKEEWAVTYLDNYREVRAGLRSKDQEPLLQALESMHYYQVEGQESYAIIEFYRHRKKIGPYISITNVKAVQTGPRKLVHRAVAVVKMLDIGWEAAEALYHRMYQEYQQTEKHTARSAKKNRRSLEDRVSTFSFNLSRKSKDMASEMKSSASLKKKHKNRLPRTETQELEHNNSEESPASIEEITVHVPHVTPEMEKEYLKKQKSQKRHE